MPESITWETPIVRDMRAAAREMGIVSKLLDALVFLRDGDPFPAFEQVQDALEALGVGAEQVSAHMANHRPAVDRTSGVPPTPEETRWTPHWPCRCGHAYLQHAPNTVTGMQDYCKQCDCRQYRRGAK